MIELVPLMKLAVEVSEPVDLGLCAGLRRRFIPIVGGVVSGGHSGMILGGGGDWQTLTPSGVLEIAARYVLSLEGELVEVESIGLRQASSEVAERIGRGDKVDRSEYYFRTCIRFRTASPALDYLNTTICISAGERLRNAVNLDVYRLT